MKKYLLSLITLALLMCEASFTGGGMAFAATSGSCGTNLSWSYNSSNTTLTISQSNTTTNSMTNWTSSNYNNSTSGRPWQEHASSITTIVINGGVKTIGNYAFKGMSSVTSIKFGTGTGSSYKSSVTTIGNNAFDGCSSLATIYYYGGISGWLGITFSNAQATPFYSKSGGGTLYIDGTTSTYKYTALTTSSNIKDYAFYKNKDLANITLNAGVTTIGASAFANCTGIATVKFGSASSTDECGITSISNNAFQGCSNVTSVYCYGGIAKWLAISFGNIASNPFCATSSNKTQYFYLNGTSTSTVTIPSNVTEIKANAFYNNRAITTLKLGTNSTTEACGVNNIRSWAFMNCTNLTTINCYGGINKWLNIAFEDVQSTPFYSSTGVKTFKLDNSAVTALIIPDDATEVKAYAFYNNTALTSVTLGTGLKNIRTNAFYGCSNLTTINFNATNCSDLSSSTQAFNNAGTAGSGITLNIGSGVNVIPGYLFYPSVSNGTASSQAKLTSVVFADESTCSTINSSAFAYTNQLTSIRLPSSITTINSSAFTSSALTSTYFDGTIAQWCNITFSSMSANPVYISKNLYINNELVENLVIPSEVEIIKANTFYNDTSITSVYIPTSVTNIASDAFNSCKNIGKTQYAGSPKQWSSITFGNKNSNPMYKSHNIYLGSPDTLTTYIYMPDDLDAIKDYAFAGNTTINEISIDPSTTPANSAFDECSANIVVRGALNGYCGDKTGGDGTNLTWTLDEGVLTISGLGAMESYSSSSKQPWYGYRNSITSIVVEDGVTTLGNNFAYSSVNATSVSLPGTLTTVGNYVFQSCTSLKAVSFPASVTSLGTNVLYGCSSLEYIIVARTESVTTLTTTSPYTSRKIYVPYSVLDTYKAATKWSDLASNIYPYTGSCGTSATWTYSPADSTLTISGTGAMADYSNGTTPWYSLRNIITTITINEGVTCIGKYAFYNCQNAHLSQLPSSLEEIKFEAFWYCYELDDVSFAEGSNLTTIGNYAFEACTTLTHITIPEKVQTFGYNAFSGCSALTTVIWNAKHCNDFTSGNGPFNSRKTAITSFIFGDSVQYIPAYLCDGMNHTDFDTIAISENVTSINQYAFNGCTSINSIIWNAVHCADFASVSGPFYALRANIQSVTFGNAVEHIPAYLCNSMNNTLFKTITIPESVTNIGTSAFSSCTHIETINYNAANIGDYSTHANSGNSGSTAGDMFNSCGTAGNGITLTFGAAVQHIPNYIFYPGDSYGHIQTGANIVSIRFDENAICSSIGSNAFKGISSLRTLQLPANMSTIGTNAFNSCPNIETITSKATTPPTLSSSFPSSSSITLYLPHNAATKTAYRDSVGWSSFTEANTFPKIVQFDLNGKSGNAIDPQFFDNLTSKASVPSEPSSSYYSFGGWFENAEGTGSAFAFSTTNITGDKILYAKWTEDLHTVNVTYKCCEATIQSSGSVSGVGVATAQNATAPEITGYTFSTWSAMPSGVTTSDELTSATISINATADDQTITANYTINSYDVTFDLQGHGTAIAAQSIEYNGTAIEPTEPEADYYTFGGWYENEGYTGSAFDFSTPITADLTLYAKWTENKYTFADTDPDNSKIVAAEGKLASSITIGRTIWKDGYYNSMCLPFSLTAEQIAASPLADYKALKRLSSATVTGSGEDRMLNIQLEPITEITAGEPFFISYEVGENISSPKFENVTVTAKTPGSINKGDVTCHGIYAKTNLAANNTNLFLGANNALYWPAAGKNAINGLRAYFTINSGSSANAGMRVRLIDQPAEVPTGMESIEPSAGSEKKYIKDGVLFIERDGKIYNAQGALVQIKNEGVNE